VDDLTEFRDLRQEVPSLPAAHGTKALSRVSAPRRRTNDYESPRVIIIGNVRDLTAGSASSGKQDANSQYYW
jgi:hypothetical protein